MDGNPKADGRKTAVRSGGAAWQDSKGDEAWWSFIAKTASTAIGIQVLEAITAKDESETQSKTESETRGKTE